MKSLVIVIFWVLIYSLVGFSQQTMELTFTAIDSASYVQLDSIKVMNRTQGGDTTLFWNDTVLVLSLPAGLSDINSRKDGFELHSYPNPVTEYATIEVSIQERGETILRVSNVLGRQLLEINQVLQPGAHSFKFIPGNERLYLLTVMYNGYPKTIKIVNSTSNPGRKCTISNQGYDVFAEEKRSEALHGFTFELGDELLYIGYVGLLESGKLDSPESTQTYTFQFVHGIPCPGTPTVTYEDQVYNTVQIFSQCWLKENLNVGTRISGENGMANNGTKEKYCYSNQPDSCIKYGGLYQWGEMMQYNFQPGSMGICPQGWHIPADEEWKVLEGSVDSYYGIGNDYWDAYQQRGTDAGTNLKTNHDWKNDGNGTDLYGFSALPGGGRGLDGLFYTSGADGFWWTSTIDIDNYKIFRKLFGTQPGIYRLYETSQLGFSVRCIKD